MTAADEERGMLERLRHGEPGAVAEIVAHFREPLVRFASGYVGARDAEDAVQEVLMKVLQSETANLPDDLRAWLYTVMRNHCLNHCRARGRRDERALPEDFDLAASLTGPVTRLEKREAAQHVDRLVEALPVEQREVLRLRYTEGLSRDQIAAVLGIAPSLVKTRLFAAMQALRRDA